MKHKDLIDIRRDYRPVFTLGQEESERDWKSYIPHQNFLELLQKVLNVVEGKEKKTAVWLQGSYGVGKSHACSVISHLLFEPWENIKDYVERDIQNPQIIGRIKNLRERKRFIPVYLIGTGDVPALEYMGFYVKSHIKRKLEELGITAPVLQTEVDRLIELIQKEDEKALLDKMPEYDSKEALLEDLKKFPPDDVAVRKSFEYFANKNIYVSAEISNWLKKVNDLIKERGYDGVLLIWDEFTQVLDTGPKHLEKLQNLLAENPDIYLIVVSHRMADFYKVRFGEQTYRKVSDRFVHHKLELAETTVFHILKRAFNKKDSWQEVRDLKFSSLSSLVDSIINLFEIQKPKAEDIRDLYPLHPYTILIATHVAEKFFSSGRSIFGFLFDENGALRKLMEKDIDKEPFLTVDTLWDYFFDQIKNQDYGDFARDIVNHYVTQEEKVRGLGEEYVKVFKTLMILNLLYKFVDNPQHYLHPTKMNVKLAYAGTPVEARIESILETIHKKGILEKSPDNKFLVHSSSLPVDEIKEEIKRLESAYREVHKVIEDHAKDEVQKILARDFYRETEIFVLPPDESYRYRIKPKHKLQIALGFYKTPAEKEKYVESFKKASEEQKNALFIIWDEEFMEDRELSGWIKWKAREKVAHNHGLLEEKKQNEYRARLVLEKFLNKDTYLTMFFRGREEKIAKREIPAYLKKCSKQIYEKGPEALNVENRNLWEKAGKALLSKLIKAERIDELESHKGPEKDLKGALYDRDGRRIFMDNLSLNDKADSSHPIVNLSKELEKKFREKQKLRVEDFAFLKMPPYGLYNNKISAFMLAAAFKPFQDKLHRVGVGRASVSDLEDFFRGILEDKRSDIELRYGSELEDKLADLLKEIFGNLVTFKEEDRDLIRIRNTIRERIIKIGFPLWALAHLDDKDLRHYAPENENYLRSLFRDLSGFIASSDTEFKKGELSALFNKLDQYRASLRYILDENNILNGRELFIKRKIGTRQISKEELGKRLREKLSQNVNFWDEGQVSSIVDKLIEELENEKLPPTRNPEPQPSVEKSSGNFGSTTVISGTPIDDDIDVESYLHSLPSYELQDLISEILKQYSEIKDFVKDWLKQRGYV